MKRYEEGRYISATEAIWRFYEFELHEMEPAVVRLALHLKGQQQVQFEPTSSAADVLATVPESTLDA